MAAGDLSILGRCSAGEGARGACSHWTLYKTRRHFIGACFGSRNAGNKFYFLRFQHTNTAYINPPQQGFPNGRPIPAGSAEINWSTEHATWGTGNVIGTFFYDRYPANTDFAHAFDHVSFQMFQPSNQMANVGTYRIEASIPWNRTDSLVFNVVAFTPGPSMVIVMVYQVAAYSGPNGVITETWSNHLNEATFDPLLRRDLSDPIANASNGSICFRGAVAGVYEDQDAPPPRVGVITFSQPEHTMTSAEISTWIGGNLDSNSFRHTWAGKYIQTLPTPIPNQRQPGLPNFFFAPAPSEMISSDIYYPGRHSLQTRVWSAYDQSGLPPTYEGNDTIISCQNLDVECDGTDGTHHIDPPTTNDRRIVFIENQRCP